MFSKTSSFSEYNDLTYSYSFNKYSDASISGNQESEQSFSISGYHESKQHSCSGESTVSDSSFESEIDESDESFYKVSDSYDHINSRTNDSINPGHISSSKEDNSADDQFMFSSFFSVSESNFLERVRPVREKKLK